MPIEHSFLVLQAAVAHKGESHSLLPISSSYSLFRGEDRPDITDKPKLYLAPIVLLTSISLILRDSEVLVLESDLVSVTILVPSGRLSIRTICFVTARST